MTQKATGDYPDASGPGVNLHLDDRPTGKPRDAGPMNSYFDAQVKTAPQRTVQRTKSSMAQNHGSNNMYINEKQIAFEDQEVRVKTSNPFASQSTQPSSIAIP